MNTQKLCVVTPIFNPLLFNSRIRLAREWLEHMLDSGVDVTIVECTNGKRIPIFHEFKNIKHVHVKTQSVIWNKENLINIGIQHNPDAEYVCWPDADIRFINGDWARETKEALEIFDFIQPWTEAIDLGPKHEVMKVFKSIMSLWHHGVPLKNINEDGAYDEMIFGHPGFCWAAKRKAIHDVGGLYELAVLGAGDNVMALSLIGQSEYALQPGLHPNYVHSVKAWEKRALHHINYNVGYTPNTIEHFFHGKKKNRGYQERWNILIDHQFDPYSDVKYNTDGVLEFEGNKPMFRRDIDLYFRKRNEDENTL